MAAAAALFATSAPALAEGPGTPNMPPPEPPPNQPPPMQAQPMQAQQPQQVPAYRTYQERRHKKSQWYGWQTLIVDGAWILGGTPVSAASPGAGAALILGGYFLGGPIVHWAHGQVGRGFADFGIRVGAPIVLSLLGYAALHKGNGNDFDGAAGAVIGAALGIIGAIVIDASVLAYEPGDDDDDDGAARTTRRNARVMPTILPMLTPRTEGGAVFGVSGTL